MKKFYITGISGTGKSTIVRKLKENDIFAIDIDEGLCKWINKSEKTVAHWHPGTSGDFFDTHDYICDQEKLFSIIENKKGPVVVVGLADNQSDFLDKFDKVFLFQCDPKILFKRIKKRTDNDFGKYKEEQDMILSWYKDFEKEMLDRGAIPIDTSKTIDKVYNTFLKEITG
jgi:dephospho-CoA kinase